MSLLTPEEFRSPWMAAQQTRVAFQKSSFFPAGYRGAIISQKPPDTTLPTIIAQRGPTGPGGTGPTGPQGIGVTSVFVTGGDLHVRYSSGVTQNAGHVEGPTGPRGPTFIPSGWNGTFLAVNDTDKLIYQFPVSNGIVGIPSGSVGGPVTTNSGTPTNWVDGWVTAP